MVPLKYDDGWGGGGGGLEVSEKKKGAIFRTMRHFSARVFSAVQILFGLSKQEGLDGRGM